MSFEGNQNLGSKHYTQTLYHNVSTVSSHHLINALTRLLLQAACIWWHLLGLLSRWHSWCRITQRPCFGRNFLPSRLDCTFDGLCEVRKNVVYGFLERGNFRRNPYIKPDENFFCSNNLFFSALFGRHRHEGTHTLLVAYTLSHARPVYSSLLYPSVPLVKSQIEGSNLLDPTRPLRKSALSLSLLPVLQLISEVSLYVLSLVFSQGITCERLPAAFENFRGQRLNIRNGIRARLECRE